MSLKIAFYVIVLLLALLGYRYYASQPHPLKKGDTAPDFELPDFKGDHHRLKDYAGQWLILYFYPKDDTPGCTKEACNFRDDIHAFTGLGAKVIGISVDNQEAHAKFVEKYHLPFPLLSDEQGEVARKYRALTEMGPIKMAKRNTFLIDPNGKLANVYLNVDASRHSTELLNDLKQNLHKN